MGIFNHAEQIGLERETMKNVFLTCQLAECHEHHTICSAQEANVHQVQTSRTLLEEEPEAFQQTLQSRTGDSL